MKGKICKAMATYTLLLYQSWGFKFKYCSPLKKSNSPILCIVEKESMEIHWTCKIKTYNTVKKLYVHFSKSLYFNTAKTPVIILHFFNEKEKQNQKQFITIHTTNGLYSVMGRTVELFQNDQNNWSLAGENLPSIKAWEILVSVSIQSYIN